MNDEKLNSQNIRKNSSNSGNKSLKRLNNSKKITPVIINGTKIIVKVAHIIGRSG